MANVYTKMLIFSVIVSVFGICTAFLLALNPPPSEDFPLRKPLVGSIFSVICTLGIIAAFYPKQCSKMSHFRKEKPDILAHERSIEIKGHHPTCGKFSAHVIHFNDHTICAACVGLALGASIALAGCFLYFYVESRIFNAYFLAVMIGVIGLVFGFFQLKFKGVIRSALNTFFVIGAFLILIGIDDLAESLTVDLFAITLIMFWLFTRMLLSKWDHSRICRSCTAVCDVAA